jgi:hypothetical protein
MDCQAGYLMSGAAGKPTFFAAAVYFFEMAGPTQSAEE